MTLSDTYLDYATLLATLTYTLGGLFYILPIPIHGVKKWGPAMIKDGIYATVWIALYKFIFDIAASIMNLLNISWGNYILTLEAEQIIIGAAYIFLSTVLSLENFFDNIPGLETIISIIGDKQFIKQLAASLGSALQFLGVLFAFSTLIEFATPFFVALGILFMSLPFRIGKKIGALLVAFSLVFYIGLPFLPSFVNLILGIIFPTSFPSIFKTIGEIAAASSLTGNILTAVMPLLQLYVTISTAYIGILAAIAYAIGEMISSGRIPVQIDVF